MQTDPEDEAVEAGCDYDFPGDLCPELAILGIVESLRVATQYQVKKAYHAGDFELLSPRIKRAFSKAAWTWAVRDGKLMFWDKHQERFGQEISFCLAGLLSAKCFPCGCLSVSVSSD